MKSLNTYLTEKLLIKKDFKCYNSETAFVEEFLQRSNLSFAPKSSHNVHSAKINNYGEFDKFLNEFHKTIENCSKNIDFPFEEVTSGGWTHHVITNDQNIVICILTDAGKTCRSTWIIGKNDNRCICISKALQGATIRYMNGELGVSFGDISNIRTYALNDNIVDTVAKFIGE